MKKTYKSPELIDRGSATVSTLEGPDAPPEETQLIPDKVGQL